MDISKYTNYFHDGYVNNIWHTKNDLSIHLESSVVEDIKLLQTKNLLSKSHTFKGILKFYNIKNFILNGKSYVGVFLMEHDDGDILDFEIKGHTVFLLIEWKNFFPKPNKTSISKIEIEAEKIEWFPDDSMSDKNTS